MRPTRKLLFKAFQNIQKAYFKYDYARLIRIQCKGGIHPK